MKRSEAKNKICPFMSQSELPTDFKRNPHFSKAFCMNADCMAWVDTKTRTDITDLSPEELALKSPPSHYDKELSDGDKEGYCVRLQESEETIIGFRPGMLNSANYERFLKGQKFEYYGNKDDFIKVKKNR